MNKSISILSTVLLSSFLAFPFPARNADASQTVPIQYNGDATSLSGTLIDGHTLLPLRDVSYLIGGEVVWNQSNRSIVFHKGNQSIYLQINNKMAGMNTHEVLLDAEPRIIGEKTYIPLRFLSVAFGYTIDWNTDTLSVNIRETPQNHITIETMKLIKETSDFVVDIQYPQIHGLSNPKVEQTMNTALRGKFTTADDVFTADDLKRLQEDRKYSSFIKYEHHRNYQIKYNQADVLSVVFDDYIYLGGAHGIPSQASYTFNLKTGQLYQLSDLFPAGNEYTTLISNDIKQQIQKGVPYTFNTAFDQIDIGTQNYYIDYDGKLVIYFDVYEYTPYSDGIPEFRTGEKIHF